MNNNTFVSNQQKFHDNFDYVNEYFKLVNQYYAQWNNGNIFCTYYSLDIENSIIDDTKLFNGAYEMVGDLSGLRWRKLLNVQLNNVETLTTTPTGDEKGVTYSEKITSAWLSNTSQLECHVHDFIVFTDCKNSDNYYLRNPPLFEVVNVERANDFDNTFYKIMLKVSYINQDKIDNQVNGLFELVDYEKRIYGIDNSIILSTILTDRCNNVCNSFYNNNLGLYLDKIDFT